MSSKEKFDACMKQVEFYIQKVYNRQSYQWKITVGLRTALIACTGFLFHKNIHPIPKAFNWIIFLGYTFIWVRAIAYRNHKDQRTAYHFRREAEALLLDDAHIVVPLSEESLAITVL